MGSRTVLRLSSAGEPSGPLVFDGDRVDAIIAQLEVIANGGDAKLPITAAVDKLDVIAHAINMVAEELGRTRGRLIEAERSAASLRHAKAVAEQASEAKSVLLRTAGHEIQMPMAGILAVAEELSGGRLAAEDHARVGRIKENGRAVMSLVGSLLDLSRLEADEAAPNAEAFSPAELIREVVASAEDDAKHKGIDLRFESEVSDTMFIVSDRARLHQVLLNLVSSAVSFTEHGRVTVSARAERRGHEISLTIDVSDSGTAAAHQQHPFSSFAKAHPMIARDHGGTGLGFAVSQGIAERLGGSLTLVRGAPERGSTLRLVLVTRGGHVAARGT